MKKIILASKSPRRKDLLDQIGIQFEIMVSEIDENLIGEMKPDKFVAELARLKAEAVAREIVKKKEDAIVIGADTVVVMGGKILGKPKNSLDAEKMLAMLSGEMHMVYTGVAVIDTNTGREETFTQKTKVYMKNISQQEIRDYVLTKEPLDKAGSYGIQGKASVFIEKIEGDYFSVMGLPVGKVYDCLKDFKKD